MAARSTRVWIHNETSHPLIHESSSLSHGIWTSSRRPKARIEPGAKDGWQSESNGVATGTEGRARYRIGDTGQYVDLHWDNPFVGPNFYEQNAGGPFGLYFEGGKDNNAEVTYHLMPPDRVAVAGYLPSRHGFMFDNNHWPDVHITSIPMPDPFGPILIGNASWGLCGGMSFASRDYFEAGLNAPRLPQRPTGEGDPLFDYIVRRLAQSLNLDDVATFVRIADPLYPDTDDILGNGCNWVMARVAWPEIRRVIDSGLPCPIGLVTGHLPDFTHLGHQVCVYAYQLQGQQLTLWVYDPNTPKNDNITIRLDISRTDKRLIDVTSNVGLKHRINCFFVQHYANRDPLVLPTRRAEYGMAAAARDPDQLDLFWTGSKNEIWSTWWRDAPGMSWSDHGRFRVAPVNSALAGSPVASLARARGHLDVFWIGSDRAIQWTWWDSKPQQGWGDHRALSVAPDGSARADSPLAAVARTPDNQDVFWISPDGAIWTMWWEARRGNGWRDHRPFAITGPGVAGAGSGLAVANRTAGHLDVFWVSPDGAIWTHWWDAAPGGGWENHKPFAITPPGVAAPNATWTTRPGRAPNWPGCTKRAARRSPRCGGSSTRCARRRSTRWGWTARSASKPSGSAPPASTWPRCPNCRTPWRSGCT